MRPPDVPLSLSLSCHYPFSTHHLADRRKCTKQRQSGRESERKSERGSRYFEGRRVVDAVEITQVKQHPPSAQPFILPSPMPGAKCRQQPLFSLESTS